MKKVVIYGSGKLGRLSAGVLKNRGVFPVAFIDSSEKKQGTVVDGLPVISLEQYRLQYENFLIVVAIGRAFQQEVTQVLEECGYEYTFLDHEDYYPGRKLISYSMESQREDIILYHVFHTVSDLFYIDVGSNDPSLDSVTKMLYDNLGAHGINIEPQKDLYEHTIRERSRDINLNVGIGSKESKLELFVQQGLSTFKEENINDKFLEESYVVDVITLKNVCEKYVGSEQEIHFLKIDVEGFEKEVLMGADLQKWRPWVVIMESTLPNTDVPCYQDWEYMLLNNHYHLAYEYGVNRYYVADEKSYLDEKFVSMAEMLAENNYYCPQKIYY